ncbi:hypothetical protein SCALM49S_05639 [Streptomyces californicus]
MPRSVVRYPSAASVRAAVAATSSALPVCEAHSTTTGRPPGFSGALSGGAGAVPGPEGSGRREWAPASIPLTHRAWSGAKGAPAGSTGVPAGRAPRPARNPAR